MVRSWLVTARESFNMSHEDVAEKAKITRQYYGMIENGQRDPSVKVAQRLGEILNVNWTIFFESTSNKKLPNNKQPVSSEKDTA
ncbi:helix-turn-helix transcriptional regulator [Paenibacillus sp. 3LSP]|uniref:helix-turn-helix transcriptional regulator n=1 Tax=Paenibacillus sp. 3LSP TaxID=2800795 RepID=UPI0028FD45F6|nr:helix-turn-helix transcriptional regulator [Paenibacillus sp. 3LSP]MDU0332569.1 helix-turn-helix transcriptional regulator [Paenibacillus sp. 3LSP]